MVKKINYYKTTEEKLQKAFCLLAEKCYHNNTKTFIYTNSQEDTDTLDKVLWTYSKKQFIPHATIHDPSPEKQPILIGENLKNLNSSLSLVGVNLDKNKIFFDFFTNKDLLISQYERLFFLYDDSVDIPKKDIENIISKSQISDIKLEFYVQKANNVWQPCST